MRPFLEILNYFLYALAAGIGLASLFGFLGRLWWRFELFSHFRVQYAALAFICAICLALLRQPAGCYFSLGVGFLNLTLLLPFYLRKKPAGKPTTTFRILTANILGWNSQYKQISSMLEKANPDLVLLVEFAPHHQEGLMSTLSGYAHTYFLPRNDNFGLALLSRLPLTSTEFVCLTEDDRYALVARIEMDDRQLTIIGAHPQPPKSRHKTSSRDRLILALARLVAQQSGEVILLGDLNTTPWSYTFGDLLRVSGLVDSRSGFGVQPTWPDKLPLMRIPIDHVLHSPGIQVHQLATGPFSGSDHRPVMVDFSMPAGNPTPTN